MSDLRALLDLYPALSPAERDAVEARAASAPEWADALAEARRFAALVDAARGAAPPPPGGDGRAATPEIDEARAAVRLRELLDADDPVRRFERLTGRPLSSFGRGGRDA